MNEQIEAEQRSRVSVGYVRTITYKLESDECEELRAKRPYKVAHTEK